MLNINFDYIKSEEGYKLCFTIGDQTFYLAETQSLELIKFYEIQLRKAFKSLLYSVPDLEFEEQEAYMDAYINEREFKDPKEAKPYLLTGFYHGYNYLKNLITHQIEEDEIVLNLKLKLYSNFIFLPRGADIALKRLLRAYEKNSDNFLALQDFIANSIKPQFMELTSISIIDGVDRIINTFKEDRELKQVDKIVNTMKRN